jgi:hypothetical protein
MGSKASTFSIACCMFNQKCSQRPRLAMLAARNDDANRRSALPSRIASELFLLVFSARGCSRAE